MRTYISHEKYGRFAENSATIVKGKNEILRCLISKMLDMKKNIKDVCIFGENSRRALHGRVD